MSKQSQSMTEWREAQKAKQAADARARDMAPIVCPPYSIWISVEKGDGTRAGEMLVIGQVGGPVPTLDEAVAIAERIMKEENPTGAAQTGDANQERKER